jgi:hypothetical protein
MKKFGLFVLLTALFTVDSCSPTADAPTPTSLFTNKPKSGILRNIATDTNAYTINLTCGCEFTMKVESAGTSYIDYDVSDLSTSIRVHHITAKVKPGGVSGTTYIDSIILVTQPPTEETFRDTLRDTLIVP